jgi:putative nucleotidyltransferase with HDIG domain
MKATRNEEFSVMQIDLGSKLLTDLPSAPIILQTVQSRISENSASSHEVSAIIESDQGFSARILKLVNSPFYGFSRKIASVEEAITMLGFNVVKQLIFTTSVLNSIKLDEHVIDPNVFWRHSFGVGVIARQLLYKASKEIREEVFLSGVLHDIGRLIMVKGEPEKFMRLYGNKEMFVDLDMESQVFEVDHQELGLMLATKWNFPSPIKAVIANHHNPEKEPQYKIQLAAVNMANLLCHAMGIGNSGTYYVLDFNQNAWTALGLTYPELKKCLKNSLEEIEKYDRSLLD